MLRINDDLTKKVTVDTNSLNWTSSPESKVTRKMLDRIGDEKARATSIVRYEKGSSFPEHIHGGGEEFLVLEGVFQDDRGSYPKGTYVRNPPGSKHKPFSKDGCVIFVKLWQFSPEDKEHVVIVSDPTKNEQILFENKDEKVSIQNLKGEKVFEFDNKFGFELFAIDGDLIIDGEKVNNGSWVRSPKSEPVKISTNQKSAKFWIKSYKSSDALDNKNTEELLWITENKN